MTKKDKKNEMNGKYNEMNEKYNEMNAKDKNKHTMR